MKNGPRDVALSGRRSSQAGLVAVHILCNSLLAGLPVSVGLRNVGLGVLHELGLGGLIAEALGLGIDVFLDGAVGPLRLTLGHAQCVGVLVLSCAGGTGNPRATTPMTAEQM